MKQLAILITFAVFLTILESHAATREAQVSKTHDGGKYVGELKDGLPNGRGTLIYANGNTYVGEFKDGNKHGQGKYSYVNGDKYVGAFREGKFHGQGTLSSTNGSYEGEFVDGYAEGQGTVIYPNGNKYVGHFWNHKRDGFGTLTYADGGSYEGEFKHDKKHGKGTMTGPNSIRVTGIFRDGNLEKGKITSANGVTSYDGEFVNHKIFGNGTTTYPNGDKFIRKIVKYENGKAMGRGVKTFANGDVYSGEVVGNERHGKGKHTFSDGRILDGVWKNNKFDYYRTGLDAYRKGNYATTLRLWTPLAEKGDVQAQSDLGVMYYLGQGVARNFKIAVKWYRLAAEQGNFNAQISLGRMYRDGEGVMEDYVYAHMWLNIAAGHGDDAAPKARNSLAKRMTPTQLENAQAKARKYVSRRATIKSEDKPPPHLGSSMSGSGFFVSKLGHIITNQHVVKSCKNITVGANANTQVRATVIETDKRIDLALLKITSTEMASADTKSLISKLGIKVTPLSSNGLLRSEDVKLGESLLVAGYPYGEIFSNTIKVTGGMVSAIRGIGDDSGQFQMDAAVQPGNSGGPIYDANGNIVGVVVAQLNKLKMAKTIGSLPENVNFGIKASTVRQFLTSAGLPTKRSARTKSMSTKELAKIAKNQTVMVICYQ
jgi:S1-C subfamily serine protease